MNKKEIMSPAQLATVEDILKINNLKIPVYQRPYTWKEQNV